MSVTIKELLVKINSDVSGLQAGMNTMERDMAKGKTAGDNLGVSVGGVAKKLAAMAAVIGAGAMFKNLITGASEFETSIANMSTLIVDSNVNVDEMAQGFLDLAGPLGTAKELADAAYGAISAGVPAGEAVEFIGQMAMFAKANLVELGAATDVVTTIMNTYGSAAGSAAEITDKLTTTIRLGKTDGEALSASLGQIAGTAKEVGISFEDLLSATVVLTSGGIKTNQAMTALKAVISNIATPSAQAEAAALGMAGGFSLGSLKAQGFSGFLQSMVAHVEGNTQKQKDLFGSIEAFNAIAVLASKEGGQKLIDTNIELKDSADATKTAFEKQTETFASSFEAIKNETQAVFIDALLPVLKDLAAIMKDEGFKTGVMALASAMAGLVKHTLSLLTSIPQAVGYIIEIVDLYNQVFQSESDQEIMLGKLNTKYQMFISNMEGARNEMEKQGIESSELTNYIQDLQYYVKGAAGDTAAYAKVSKDLADGKYGEKLQLEWVAYTKALVAGQQKLKDAAAGTKTLTEKEEELIPKTAALVDINKEFNASLKLLQDGAKAGTLKLGEITKAYDMYYPAIVTSEKKTKEFVDVLDDFIKDAGPGSAIQLEAIKAILENSKKPADDFMDIFEGGIKTMEDFAGETEGAAFNSESLAKETISVTDAMGDSSMSLQDVRNKIGEVTDKYEKGEISAGEYEAQIKILNAELERLEGTFSLVSAAINAFGDVMQLVMPSMSDLTSGIASVFSSLHDIEGILAAPGKLDFTSLFGAGISVLMTVADLIGSTDWAGYATAEAKALGISVEMTGQLAALAEEMGTVNGALYVLMDEIIADENIKDLESFNFWLSEIARMMGAVGNGAVPVSELGEAFGALLENADDIGYLGRGFQSIIGNLEEMGISLTEINDFMENEMIEGAAGYADFLEAGFSDAVLPTLQSVLDYQTLLADNSALVAGVEGWEDAIDTLGNTGNITFENFGTLLGGATDGFNALIAAGFSEKQALELMQPQLAALIALSDEYGFAIDAETQAIINKGEKYDIEFEKEKSANDIIADQMTRLVEIFERLLPDALDDFAAAGETAFGKYTNWIDATTLDLENMAGAFPTDIGVNAGGPGGGPGGEPGFAEGTRGRLVPIPSSFLVGESGPERIQTKGGRMKVTPLGGGGSGEAGGGETIMNVYFNISAIDGPSVDKFMREQAMPMITAASRTGNFTIHGGAVVN